MEKYRVFLILIRKFVEGLINHTIYSCNTRKGTDNYSKRSSDTKVTGIQPRQNPAIFNPLLPDLRWFVTGCDMAMWDLLQCFRGLPEKSVKYLLRKMLIDNLFVRSADWQG